MLRIYKSVRHINHYIVYAYMYKLANIKPIRWSDPYANLRSIHTKFCRFSNCAQIKHIPATYIVYRQLKTIPERARKAWHSIRTIHIAQSIARQRLEIRILKCCRSRNLHIHIFTKAYTSNPVLACFQFCIIERQHIGNNTRFSGFKQNTHFYIITSIAHLCLVCNIIKSIIYQQMLIYIIVVQRKPCINSCISAFIE